MLEALIAGQRNPKIDKMRARRKELTEALDGRFEDHRAELARILLDQIGALTWQVDAIRPGQRADRADPRRASKPVTCSNK
jgi:transposase